jgi:ATP phosphoribosyltransferase regulatory subunit
MTKPLLPSGCYDLLPPFARQESVLSHTLFSVFESFGYEQVSPPLLEYSDNLLAGRGSSLSSQIFRVMDSAAHKVMGIRADITLQIARIAVTRLSHAPRPLRLCYNGLILRMQGEQLKKDRQLHQAGIELIGSASAEADAEVIVVAATALEKAGINTISIDLNLPSITSSLLANEKLDGEDLKTLLAAIAHKDVSAIGRFSLKYSDALIGLVQHAGSAENVLAAMETFDMPESACRQCEDLRQVVEILKKRESSDWNITIDATENRGIDYHSGISFSIFVPSVAYEVGRGGRYKIQGEDALHDLEATGFTLYLETLLDILPKAESSKRVFIAGGIAENTETLRAEGYSIVYAISKYGNNKDEAKRLGCGWMYEHGKLIQIT